MTTEFTENLWKMDEKALVSWMTGRKPDQADFQFARAVLEAEALIASRQVAVWTKRLTWATFTLAGVAVLALLR
jgi:hypothetical protein